MSQQKIVCHDRTWAECNKLAETKKINVATRFVSWMSTLRRTYPRHKSSCRDTGNKRKKNSVATRYLVSRQEIKEQYRKNTATNQFMLRHIEKYKAKSMSRQNLLMSRH